MEQIKSVFKILGGVLSLSVITPIIIAHLILMLPFRLRRIRACNYYGHVVGRYLVWITGSKVDLHGKERLNPDRPAIYVANHASILDIFLAVWLAPVGTVGVGKKEVVYYPFFGQAYFLSGHLLVDRGNNAKAIQSLNRLVKVVRKNRLSIFIWPEGTRSRSGRLLNFKKGVAHLAIQTGLPVVPLVFHGTHKCWEKNSLKLIGVPVRVDVLPEIETTNWKLETIRDHLAQIRQAFIDVLPPDQKPIPIR